MSNGLWIVTAYYNPCGYKTRRYNYEIFAKATKQSGVPLLTIECAFGGQNFDLPGAADVIQMKSNSLIWQKERLLNLAISWLPRSCDCVAWLDCDLIFSNANWAKDIIALLQLYPLVQVFETCNRLPGNICHSFASMVARDPNLVHLGHFEKHGHTGYGWAARRELLDKHGLYEYAVIGSADHYMAHAALGDFDGACMGLMTDHDSRQIQHFRDWAEPFYESVQGNVGAVPGEVFHLWHGNLENRKYLLRNRELTKLCFNPYADLVAVPGKPLEWKPELNKTGLKELFERYFTSRKEDGDGRLSWPISKNF